MHDREAGTINNSVMKKPLYVGHRLSFLLGIMKRTIFPGKVISHESAMFIDIRCTLASHNVKQILR